MKRETCLSPCAPRVARRSPMHQLSIFAVLALLAIGAFGIEQPPLTRLVGQGDILWQDPPGLTLEYALEPHAAGEYVAFFALATAGPSVVSGVWLWDGNSYNKVVDSMSPPGQNGILTGRAYSVDETGLVAVTIETYAMVAWRNGTLFTIAAIGDQPPDGPPGSEFSALSHPMIAEGVVYFLAGLTNLPASQAIRPFAWSEAGGLREVQLPPGRCCPTVPAGSEDRLFIGATDPLDPLPERAYWRRDVSGRFSEFFRLGEPFPGSPGAYWLLPQEQLGVTSTGIVVMAEDSNHTIQGIYRIREGSVVEPVMVTGDPDLGTGYPIWGVRNEFSAAGERIAFRTGDHTAELPYRVILQETDRSLHSIVAAGDVLEGGLVNYVDLSYGGLADDRLAIEVQRGNDIAVWLADLGGPSSALEVPLLSRIGLAAFAALLGAAALVGLRR